MDIKYGKGTTEYGPGVEIHLTGNEMAKAVHLYLYSQDIYISGASTVSYNGALMNNTGQVYVDPSGRVIADGVAHDGRGPSPSPKFCDDCGCRLVSSHNWIPSEEHLNSCDK